jgi:hypothetical protein
MAKRFPFIVSFAVPTSIAEALTRATADELLTQSDYCGLALRKALAADGFYVAANGGVQHNQDHSSTKETSGGV